LILCTPNLRDWGSQAEASQPRSGGGEGAAARTRTQAEQVGGSGRVVEPKTAKPFDLST